MVKKIFSYIGNYPRLSLIYGFLGGLLALFLLLTVNEHNFRPVQGKAHWTITSNFSPALAAAAIDQNLKSAWSSYAPLSFGMYVQADLHAPRVVNGLLLRVREDQEWGLPVEWIVKTSADGAQWREVTLQQSLADHAGRYLMQAILFTPVRARYIQMIAMVNANVPWAINELDLFQPILPWQFERSTILFWILGSGLLLLAMIVFLPGQGRSWQNVLLPVLLLLAVLLGWGLRVYDLRSYEPSPQEWSKRAFLDFDASTAQWLKGYLAYTQTGASWLAFLFTHWAAQLFSDPLVAMRIAPALFGIGSVLLIFFFYNLGILGKNKASVRWEGLLAAALVSVAGFPIFLGRRGEFAVSLCFFILLYLLATYHFLYRQGAYWWILGLILLALTGFWVDPAMGDVPPGIVLLGGVPLVGAARRGAHTQLKNQAFRLSLYLLSLFPLYSYRVFFLKQDWSTLFSFASASFPQIFWRECSQALQFSGFAGIGAWLFGGLAIVGGVHLLFRRNYGEWFVYAQGLIFTSVAVLCSPPEKSSVQFCLSVTLALCLVAKGGATILAGFESEFQQHAPRFGFIRIVTLILLVGYLALFSSNSLFLGYAGYPYASALYETYRQEKRLKPLMQQIVADPNPCKAVGVLNRRLAGFYTATYNLPAYFTQAADLRKSSETGEFWPYLFVPAFLPNTDRAEITPVLNRCYAEVGKTALVTLYKVKDEFYAQRQHYASADVFSNTGELVKDPSSSSGKVRYEFKDEAPGMLAFTPSFRLCQAGRYTARFAVRSAGETANLAAILEVVANRYDSLARLELTGKDFGNSPGYRIFDLPFQLDLSANPAFQMKRLQCVVHFTGKADVWVDYIELIPAALVK